MFGRRHFFLVLTLALAAAASLLVRIDDTTIQHPTPVPPAAETGGAMASESPTGFRQNSETAAQPPVMPLPPGRFLPSAGTETGKPFQENEYTPPDSFDVPPPLPAPAALAWQSSRDRESLAQTLREYSLHREAAAREEARRRGFPARTVDNDGRTLELVAFENGVPLYRTTFNAVAAQSVRSRPILGPGRFSATGKGVHVGVWDEARILASHSEFDRGRVINHHSAPFFSHHSTHVAGTIAARGTHAPATGVAPQATIEGYDWNQALAEMAGRAPFYPGEPGTISLANHSYGLVAGWVFLGERNAFVFTGHDRFGRYDEFAYLTDVLAHSSPYLLSVWAAGNHRSGDPRKGDPVLINDRVVPYDPELHPPGDAVYKRGFDTVNSYQIAKNVLTVGAIDFLPASQRSGRFDARMTAFSSWGPTDDGRIKPDLVAHGVGVLSPVALDGWYGRASGTSMAAPATTGSLALLTELYREYFPGHAPRASTLKALLIHSADDLGNPGPDYRYGWGLINTEAAAAIVRRYAASPRSRVFIEDSLTSSRPAREYRVTWDEDSPILATLSWTDPPPTGPVSETDQRSPTLVNNLHLSLLSPDGSFRHHPFRLDPANPAAPATTGRNHVDNTLRVDIPEPQNGTYTVRVEYDEAQPGSEQIYSLIVTGASVDAAETTVTQVDFIEPQSAPNNGVAVVEIHGAGFLPGTNLRLTGPQGGAAEGFGIQVTPSVITARFDLYAAPAGQWNLELFSPDGDSIELPEVFEVEPACHFTLGEGTVTLPSQGGYFTARLESSLTNCQWSLESSADWLLFLTPRSGSGSTDVIYGAAAHQGSALPRTATISAGGRVLLTVEQAGVEPTTLAPGSVRADFITGRERQYDWKYYRVEVPHMQAGQLEVVLAGLSGDADLYVRKGEKPDLNSFDCRPFLAGVQEEFCQFLHPEPGVWWVGVNNWDTGRIDYLISANVSIHAIHYDDWARNAFGTDAMENPQQFGPMADPGDRGVPNLMRYALGLDPSAPLSASLPRAGILVEKGESYPYIDYTRLKAATDITFHVEASTDLQSWEPAEGQTETLQENPTVRTVRFRLADPVQSPEPYFLRLRLEKN